jgi:2-polyprenyl-3-methyl-5-hydroxy-6-metoxy-1,4-benzoquinol methylase
MELVQVRCNNCGSLESKPFLKTKKFSAARCNECSLVYVAAREPAENKTDYFGDTIILKNIEYYKHFREQAFDRALKLLEQFKPSKGKVLEIGSSFGWFLHAASQRGWQATGLEPSKTSVAEMKKLHNYSVVNAPVAGIKDIPQTFDVVAMWNVLEHLPDPASVLKEVYRKLNSGGVLAIAVPNLNGLITQIIIFTHKFAGRTFDREIDRLYQSDNPFMHVYHFSEITLRQMLERNGFEVIKIVKQDIIDVNKIGARLELDHAGSKFNWIRAFALRLLASLSHLLGVQDELVVYARKV